MPSPTLHYLDPTGRERSVELSGRAVVTLGRRPEADVCLPWDPGISRLHAELTVRAGEWVIADDGLSQNGTYVNGLPLHGRRRLHDGDLITLGRTSLTFCDPAVEPPAPTLTLPELQPMRFFSEQQQRILRRLCAPLLGDGEGLAPARDDDIAAALDLPVAMVQAELDTLAHSFGHGGLAPLERRTQTALTALRSGLVAHEGED
jgi:hypothetical protein